MKTQLVPFLAEELTDEEKETIARFRPKIELVEEKPEPCCGTINEKACKNPECLFCTEIHFT